MKKYRQEIVDKYIRQKHNLFGNESVTETGIDEPVIEEVEYNYYGINPDKTMLFKADVIEKHIQAGKSDPSGVKVRVRKTSTLIKPDDGVIDESYILNNSNYEDRYTFTTKLPTKNNDGARSCNEYNVPIDEETFNKFLNEFGEYLNKTRFIFLPKEDGQVEYDFDFASANELDECVIEIELDREHLETIKQSKLIPPVGFEDVRPKSQSSIEINEFYQSITHQSS